MTSQRDQQLERRIINEIPYQVLVEQSLVGIYLIQDGILKYCNTAFAGITGHTPEQAIGRNIATMVAPESIHRVLNNIDNRIGQGIGNSTRYFNKAVHVDGYLVDLEVHGRSILHEGRPAIAGVAVNVTKRLKYEREFRESHDQLQQLTRYTIKLREQRRQEMAREIHDVLGGLLTSIKMDATRILNHQPSANVAEIAEDIINLAQESIHFARHKSEQLYPTTLTYLGLKPALDSLLNQFQQRSELACQLVTQSPIPRLSADAELMVYRIVQESLTNVVRHARATEVTVTLSADADQLQACILDDGIGIHESIAREGSLGLLFMRERAADFDGELTVTGIPEGGTRVCLILPLNERNRKPVPLLEPGMRL
ncbi:PAS domain-containing sensor histidine kinase [Candidatus Thalassolituus haligoni]|uniref:PAS domain-containing sensor histidine kinase n=1 Tax=Candidatus Thalassolituus haligoni TaxID=3100113 RepID=UPI003516B970|tara:strand:+ start:503 stop:1612 length:1110 start_codon:yes stop_codon:yes gene_type:complete